MKRLLMTVAIIEAIVVALSLPVLQMSDTSTNMLSIGVAVLMLLLIPGLVRFEWGVLGGWLIQGYVIVISFQNWALFVLAVIFGAIWVWAYFLGKQIDMNKRQ
jgi:hypothetical protein